MPLTADQRKQSRAVAHQVRDYLPGDRQLLVASLRPVLAELYPDGDSWLEHRLDDVEDDKALVRLVLGTGDRLAGAVIETPKSERRSKLSTLWVADDQRQMGRGAALIDDRRRDWLRRGVQEASLTARAELAPSLAGLLVPRGFDWKLLEADRYGPGQDEVVFEWRTGRDPGDRRSPRRRLRWAHGRLSEKTTGSGS